MSVDIKTTAIKTSKAECKNGEKCPHAALGKCKFVHTLRKVQSHKIVKQPSPPVNMNRLVRFHAARINGVRRQIAAADSKSFVDVRSGHKAWSDIDELESLRGQMAMLKDVARAAIGSNKIRATLYEDVIGASAANTAVAVSIPLTPSNCTEWTSFASLYDEAIVTAVDCKYVVGFNASAPTPVGGGAVWVVVGYDSTYNSTPTGAAEVMESTQHKVTAATTAIDYAVTPHAPSDFRITIPRGPVANATAVTGGTGIVANFPGQWMAIGDTADSVGYLRLYINAGGASCVMGYRMLRAFHCEFRERT